MAIDRYLVMTAAEIASNPALPPGLGYMACHFSPYSTGLSNCPDTLPEGAMLILNDRTPIHGHSPDRIAGQLRELVHDLKCGSVLLDFQRSGEQESFSVAQAILAGLPCPVGVSEPYARELDCPVFLPPVPPDTTLGSYLTPWRGREVWLEAALDSLRITLTPVGAIRSPLPRTASQNRSYRDAGLHCRYHISTGEQAEFTLWREAEDLDELLAEAEKLGITRTIGLFQELRDIWT